MKKAFLCLAISGLVAFNTNNAHSENATDHNLPSILELMLEVITPATNTLWGTFPESDEDWALMEEAAMKTIEATVQAGTDGAGPMDADWISNPAYQAFNDAMLNAGKMYLEAIESLDIDALYVAGDALYTPCEGCHLAFNPAVINQQ